MKPAGEVSKVIKLQEVIFIICRFFLSDFLLLLMAITVATLAVIEISARGKVLESLQLRKSELYKDLTNIQAVGNSVEEIKIKNADIQRLNFLILDIEKLAINGAFFNDNNLAPLLVESNYSPEKMSLVPSETDIYSKYVEATIQGIVNFFLIPQKIIVKLSNDMLYALTIMMCSIIGKFTAGMRTGESRLLQDIFLGLATGFITFLSLKGFGNILFSEAKGYEVKFNPYGGAFVGLLAGLFTEKTYGLINKIVDTFISNMETSLFDSKKEKGDNKK